MRLRKRCRFLAGAVLVMAVLAAIAGCDMNIPDPILDPAPIDSASDVGQYCAMAQATGALLIAYHDETNGRLKVARSADNGQTWSTRFLDWDWQSHIGHHVSIAASGSLVAVAYRVEDAADLRLAVWDGTAWTLR